MKRGGRALVESLVLHGLLAGAVIAMAETMIPPPPTIRLDFSMMEPRRPQATAPVVAASPPSPTARPTPPAPQTKPVVPAVVTRPPKPTPAADKPRPVAVKPKPLPAKLKPAPPKPLEPVPKVAAVVPEAAPLPSPPPVAAPPAPEISATPDQTTAAVGGDAMPADDNQGQESRPTGDPVAAVEEYRHANFGTIRSSILANLRYPLVARRKGWSGMVEVAFLVAPDGSVSDLRIQASSGFPVLDEQALAAVRSSAPFTPPRMAALLVVPVTFRLN